MSGSRDHFTDKLRQELKSALTLLMKSLGHHAVDLTLPLTLTIYAVHMKAESYAVPLQDKQPDTFDPLAEMASARPKVSDISLAVLIRLSEVGSCHFDTDLCQTPMLNETAPPLHAVSFEAMAQRPSHALAVPALTPPATLSWDEVRFKPSLKTQSHSQGSETLKTKTRTLPLEKPGGRKSRSMPSYLYGLPMKKTALPPHRFSTRIRDRFKRTLAEKNGTIPTNIQLNIIFDRMDMSLFSSIDQDEKGNLLCFPKSEMLGRNSTRPAPRLAESVPTYLVFGTRLDTGENIKALVPIVANEESA